MEPTFIVCRLTVAGVYGFDRNQDEEGFRIAYDEQKYVAKKVKKTRTSADIKWAVNLLNDTSKYDKTPYFCRTATKSLMPGLKN